MHDAFTEFATFYRDILVRKDTSYHRLIAMVVPVSKIVDETYQAVNQFRNQLTETYGAEHFVYYDTSASHYIKLFIHVNDEHFVQLNENNHLLVNAFVDAAEEYRLTPSEDNKLVIQPIFAMEEYELMSKVCLMIIGDNYNPLVEIERAVEIFEGKFLRAESLDITHKEHISNHDFIHFLVNFSGMMNFFPFYIRFDAHHSSIAFLIVDEPLKDITGLLEEEWKKYYNLLHEGKQTDICRSTVISHDKFATISSDPKAVSFFIVEQFMEHSQWAK